MTESVQQTPEIQPSDTNHVQQATTGFLQPGHPGSVKLVDTGIVPNSPGTPNVTVEGLDVTRYPQGSMAASHGMRLPSHSGPYLDEPLAMGQDTTAKLDDSRLVGNTAIVGPSGQLHTDIYADSDVTPYAEVNNVPLAVQKDAAETSAEENAELNARRDAVRSGGEVSTDSNGTSVNSDFHLDGPVTA